MNKPLVVFKVIKDSDLQKISVPTLAMFGENEKLFSPNKAIKRLNKIAPQIETQLLQDGGHDLSLAQAESVNKLIINFVDTRVNQSV